MELSAVQSVTPSDSLKSIAVLGSGPLPLTSICISQALENRGCRPVCIHNIDRDRLAITKSLRLSHALGYTEKSMSFQCADALSETLSLDQFDVVYLAALVGTCHGHKHDIIASVAKRMSPGALLVARSAHSLRSLLYPVSRQSVCRLILLYRTTIDCCYRRSKSRRTFVGQGWCRCWLCTRTIISSTRSSSVAFSLDSRRKLSVVLVA